MVRMRTQCGKVSNDELLLRKSSVDEMRRRTGTVSTGSPTPWVMLPVPRPNAAETVVSVRASSLFRFARP